jgi:hypothetical protein
LNSDTFSDGIVDGAEYGFEFDSYHYWGILSVLALNERVKKVKTFSASE